MTVVVFLNGTEDEMGCINGPHHFHVIQSEETIQNKIAVNKLQTVHKSTQAMMGIIIISVLSLQLMTMTMMLVQNTAALLCC